MAEEAKAVAAEVSVESSIEDSRGPTGESAATRSDEHSQTEGEHATTPAAEVEKASPSVDAIIEGSPMHEAEEKPAVEGGDCERLSSLGSSVPTANRPSDIEVDDNACDTEPNAPPSDDMTNPKDCGGDPNDASENAVKALSEGNEGGGGIADEDEIAVPTADAAECEDGNDKAAATSSGMIGSTPENETEMSPAAASPPRANCDQIGDAQINRKGACPCVYVTSNLIGMRLSERSGSEQHRRRNSGPTGIDGINSHHAATFLRTETDTKADRASMSMGTTLGSSISPNASPSKSPGRRRRRPGISPLQRSTWDGDAGFGASGNLKQSRKMAKLSGLHDGPDRGMKAENGGDGCDIKSTASAFLVEHHVSHFLCLNLTGAPANEQTAALFNNQIVNCPWTAFDLEAKVQPASSSGSDTSSCFKDQSDRHRSPSTPSLSALLDICYTIAAYQALGSQNVACVYCSNGRTRTGVAIACYLKYAGRVRTSLDGFRLFCARCNDSGAKSKVSPASNREQGQCREQQDVASLIPPSLLQLFHNFDNLVDLRAWPNPQPLRLRAVTMQNVPVDNLPVVEIWSGASGQIYNSHGKDCSQCESESGLLGASAQWGCDNEEGFYLVDEDIQGEFTLTCRFGGPYADDTHDSARILFRVSNHCAFFTWGPNELRRGKVDIMRRYVDSFEDDFALVLLFEPIGGLGPSTATTESYLPPIMGGIAAIEHGLRLIIAHHSLQIEGENSDDDDWTSGVARRLANNDDASVRQVAASPQMVGIQNAITAHKSKVIENENFRFNPIIPTSETPDAIAEGNATGLSGQSNSPESKVVDTRGALLSAIVTRGKDEGNGAEKSPVDPRAALLSAIKSNGPSCITKPEEKGPGDPRAGVLDAVKARTSNNTTENGGADPRASMLAAIRIKQRPEDADEKSDKEEIDPSPPPLDPRAAMLSAIKAKKTEDHDEVAVVKNASTPSPLDPRAAMLSAIKVRQNPAEDGKTAAKEEMKPAAPPLDPRAAMLSAIKARQKVDDNDDKDAPEKEATKPPAPPLDPRAAMLSAITARQNPAEDGKTAAKEEMKPAAPPLDPRAAMLSAIKARQKVDDNDDKDAPEKEATKPPAPPLDPRAAMLSAITARQNRAEDGETAEKEEMKPAAPPLDPRAAMLAAIKAKQKPSGEEDAPEKEATKPPAPPLDPRAAMLSAITARQNPAEDGETAEKEEMKPAAPPLDPRAAMLSAIKARQKVDDNDDKDAPEKEATKPPAPPLDPRAAMLSAITARQNRAEDRETAAKEEMKPAAPPLDPRAAMLAAIKAKQKPSGEEDAPEKERAKQATAPLDPRAAMLSAITARQNSAEDRETAEKEEMKPAAPSVDPRAAMLAAIKAKQKSSEDNTSKSAEDAKKMTSTTSALTPSDQILKAMKSRGTDGKSSQLLDLLDTIAFGCDDTLELESNSYTSVADSESRFHPSTVDYVPYDQPFMPSSGDVLSAFGSSLPLSSNNHADQGSPVKTDMPHGLYSRPLLPLHPSKESNNLQPMQQFLAQFESREDIASCIELLDKMPRSGIQIDDLMHLLAQSRRWSTDELNRIQQTMAMRQSVIADASLTLEGAAANAAAALAGQFHIASGASAADASAGPSKGAQAAADAVSQRLENSASVSQIAKDINHGGAPIDDGDEGGPKLKDDPLYSKYFRMLNVGLPVGAVKNALQRDGQDPSIMDLDQNRPIEIQLDERNKYREFEMSEWM